MSKQIWWLHREIVYILSYETEFFGNFWCCFSIKKNRCHYFWSIPCRMITNWFSHFFPKGEKKMRKQIQTCKLKQVVQKLYLTTPHIKKTKYHDNSIVKSMSISQTSKFYRRAVSKFLYTMYNQCDIFHSLYRKYELKILRVSVKLAHMCIYFTEKYERRRLMWLTVLLRLQYFCCFSNFKDEHCKNYWLYRKMLQMKVVQNMVS